MASSLTVVMYHHIFESKSEGFSGQKGLDAATLKAQIAHLRKQHTFVSLDQVVSALKGEAELPNRACLLTFDDGYIEHFLTVLPILAEEKIKGVFFPSAMPVIERRLLDSNKIHFLLGRMSVKQLTAFILEERARLGETESNEAWQKRLTMAFHYDNADVTFIKRALQRELPAPHRIRILNTLFRKNISLDEGAIAEEFYMDSAQVRGLHQAGMALGNHGWAHPWLDTLNEAEQLTDIAMGLEALRRWTETKQEDWCFCYPYGARNEKTLAVLESLGCRAAFTTEAAEALVVAENRLSLPRWDTNRFL